MANQPVEEIQIKQGHVRLYYINRLHYCCNWFKLKLELYLIRGGFL